MRGRREQAVVAASGLGRNTVGDLALHQNHQRLKILRIIEEPQQNFGGDVVRQIADHLRRLGLELDARPPQPRLGTKQRIEIDRENVGLDHFDVRKHAKAQPKLRRQHAVDLNRDQAARPLGQRRSQNPAPGADFEHRLLRRIAQRVDNLQGVTVAGQKMLSQLGFQLGAARGNDLGHVDPLFLGR